MEKTKDLFKKNRVIKGTLHAMMGGTLKGRNIKDLREAEEIKNRWQEHRRTIQGLNETQWYGLSPRAG